MQVDNKNVTILLILFLDAVYVMFFSKKLQKESTVLCTSNDTIYTNTDYWCPPVKQTPLAQVSFRNFTVF